MLQRTAQELNGDSCISIEELPEKKQPIISRSFRERVTNTPHFRSLVSGYIARACEKLRQQGCVARMSLQFRYAHQYSADTSTFIKMGCYILKRLYKEGFDSQKTGIREI